MQNKTKPYKCDCCKVDIKIPSDYQPKFDKTVDVEVVNPVYCAECNYVMFGKISK